MSREDVFLCVMCFHHWKLSLQTPFRLNSWKGVCVLFVELWLSSVHADGFVDAFTEVEEPLVVVGIVPHVDGVVDVLLDDSDDFVPSDFCFEQVECSQVLESFGKRFEMD